MTKEPKIIINGFTLAEGEAMTIRVAIEGFAMYLTEEGLGEDEGGKKLAAAYLNNINSMRKYIYRKQKEEKCSKS